MTHQQSDPHCELCGHILRHVGEDFMGKQILSCDRCRYVLTPVSRSNEANALYDDPEYFDGWGCNLEFDYERFEPSIHQQVQNYLDFIGKHTRGKSLLDVGTGSGLLPHMARARDYEVEATDLSRHVSEKAAARTGFAIHHGLLEEIAFTRTYDIVTLLHVLEHTAHPLATLRRCRELLNDGGYVVVVVPNYLSVDTRIKNLLSRLKLKHRPYKHLALGHHNFVFSLKTLELLGERCGFEIVHRETAQPAWRANPMHRAIGRYGLASWCWIVYRKPSS